MFMGNGTLGKKGIGLWETLKLYNRLPVFGFEEYRDRIGADKGKIE